MNAIQMAHINLDLCIGCGVCENTCPDHAGTLQIDPSKGERLDLERFLTARDE